MTKYEEHTVDMPIGYGGYESYDSSSMRSVRSEAIQEFGFAIMTDAAAELIAAFSPILEVGAGSGYWTWELQAIGADAVATDPDPFSCVGCEVDREWVEVERLNADQAMELYPGRTVLSVWPSLGDTWLDDALRVHKPERLVLVGEGAYGCTASPALWDALDELGYAEVSTFDLPQWSGIHDYGAVYELK